jgi:hypothetical protein
MPTAGFLNPKDGYGENNPLGKSSQVYRASVRSPLFSLCVAGWTIVGVDTQRLIREATEHLQEQAQLLGTSRVLTEAELGVYEERSKRIRDLIWLLSDG